METNVSFLNPPVVETVLSAQFAPVDLTLLHAGLLWSEVFGREEWPNVIEDAYLQDEIERFGEEGRWASSGGGRVLPPNAPNRAKLVNRAGDRMVQVQQSRFVLNWIKRDADYPRYARIRDEFQVGYSKFCSFVQTNGLGVVSPNQWEVTYVNHFVKGDDWDSLSDLRSVLCDFGVPDLSSIGSSLQSSGANWTFLIGDDLGKLRCTVQLARMNKTLEEVVRFQLVARGPCRQLTESALFAGFDVGHLAIVRGFTELTTTEAHKKWGRHDHRSS